MNNTELYNLTLLIKEKVLEVMEYHYLDYSPLNILLDLEEDNLNKILRQFRGNDNYDLYYRDGNFHYAGHRLKVPKTKDLMNYIRSLNIQL